MGEVLVNASTSYSVIVRNGLLKDIGAYISAISVKSKVMVVTDSNVDKLYGDAIIKALKSNKFDAYKYVFKSGEKSKSLKTYSSIIEFLSENDFTKTDIIIGFGGGIACDIAGFVAATYLRGVKLAMVPTTLLCDVDASVGGKNGLNYNNIKNQIGTVYQPLGVFIDPMLLKTLKKDIFNDGMAEVIKYSIIDNRIVQNKKFFDLLEEGNIEENLEDIISACVAIKAGIVESDEFDTGKRHILNLGHTFAHAIESASENKISHGKAVAIGMRMVGNISAKENSLPQNQYLRIIKLLDKYFTKKNIDYSPEQLEKIILHDKKIRNSTINIIKPYSIGDVRIEKIELSNVKKLLKIALS